jgi:hypothetical protein
MDGAGFVQPAFVFTPPPGSNLKSTLSALSVLLPLQIGSLASLAWGLFTLRPFPEFTPRLNFSPATATMAGVGLSSFFSSAATATSKDSGGGSNQGPPESHNSFWRFWRCGVVAGGEVFKARPAPPHVGQVGLQRLNEGP